MILCLSIIFVCRAWHITRNALMTAAAALRKTLLWASSRSCAIIAASSESLPPNNQWQLILRPILQPYSLPGHRRVWNCASRAKTCVEQTFSPSPTRWWLSTLTTSGAHVQRYIGILMVYMIITYVCSMQGRSR